MYALSPSLAIFAAVCFFIAIATALYARKAGTGLRGAVRYNLAFQIVACAFYVFVF